MFVYRSAIELIAQFFFSSQSIRIWIFELFTVLHRLENGKNSRAKHVIHRKRAHASHRVQLSHNVYGALCVYRRIYMITLQQQQNDTDKDHCQLPNGIRAYPDFRCVALFFSFTSSQQILCWKIFHPQLICLSVLCVFVWTGVWYEWCCGSIIGSHFCDVVFFRTLNPSGDWNFSSKLFVSNNSMTCTSRWFDRYYFDGKWNWNAILSIRLKWQIYIWLI